MNRATKWVSLAVVVVLIAAGLVIGVWYWNGGAEAHNAHGQTVELAGGAPAEVRLADNLTLHIPEGGVPQVGARLEVTPATVDALGTLAAPAFDLKLSSGQPTTPWKLLLKRPSPLPADSLVVFVSERPTTPGTLAPEDVTAALWNANRTEATFTVDHLSRKLFEEFSSATVSTIGKLINQRTDPPTCQGQRPQWVDRAIFLEGDLNAPLLTCMGADPGNSSIAVVKIANNRGGALVIRAPTAPTWSYVDRQLGSLQGIPPRLLGDVLDRIAESPVDQAKTWIVQPGDELHLGFSEESVRATSRTHSPGPILRPESLSGS